MAKSITKMMTPNECFRVYTYAEESYADHSDFLVTRSRYANLFAMSITDYKGWATGLKADGYATNPKYAEILIKTIEDNNLTQYDQIGLAEISAREKMMNPETQPEQAPVAIKTKPQPSHKTITATVQATPTIIATATTPEIASVQPATTKTEILKPAKSTEVKTTTINGLRAMVAQGVTDPLAVAYDNQIDYEQVLAFNDLNDGDKFKDGENIFLQNKKARASQAQYVVQEGESMHDIAQKFGVKLRDLYQKNLMQQNDQPLSGEVVYLQEKRSAAPKTMAYSEYLKSLSKVGKAQSNNNGNGSSSTQPGYNKTIVQYTVAQSDTLYSIAKRFNVTVQQLSDLNNLQGQALKPGQTLVVTQ